MEILKQSRVLLILALAVIASVFFFSFRIYHNDIKALEGFNASYKKFDDAILDFSISKTDDSEIKASDALIELNAKATFRVSSFIKNDRLIPASTLEVAELSAKELESLKAYKEATQSKNVELGGLAKEYSDLATKRKTAYALFQSLGRE